MGVEKKVIILNDKDIKRKVIRMAHEIIEKNFREREIILIGISQKGLYLSQKLFKELKEIANFSINIFKIDLNKKTPYLTLRHTIKQKEIENKTVIIVDDVLNTGKTMIYAIQEILKMQPKYIQTLVLVDRDHRNFPIKADFIGTSLSTTLQDYIYVDFLNEKSAFLSLFEK